MRKILFVLCLVLALTGCKTIADIKPDTIVDIPLRPTELQTQPATEIPTEPMETQPTETEPLTEAATEKPDSGNSGGKPTGSGSKPTGGKTPGKENTGSKPPATQPPTDPPTDPPTEAPTAPPSYDPAGYSPGSLDRAVADAVNEARREAGLESLTLDHRLCMIASVRAYELSRQWSHTRPDGSDGLTVLGQYGFGYGWAAENLHNGGGNGARIVERWMRSEANAANVLSESAAVIGVGTYTDSDGVIYLAAIFAG